MEGLKLAKGGQRGNGKQGESHVMCVSKFELLPKSTARHEEWERKKVRARSRKNARKWK
ncbi:hypothetical protein IC582_024422 [Cucumis melo]